MDYKDIEFFKECINKVNNASEEDVARMKEAYEKERSLEFERNEKTYHVPKKYDMCLCDDGKYRIKALVDILDPLNNELIAKSGEVGGKIEKASNLSQLGSCWVDYDSTVLGDAVVTDNAVVKNSKISTNAVISENALVVDSLVLDNAVVTSDAEVNNAVISDNAYIGGQAFVAAREDGQRINICGNTRLLDVASLNETKNCENVIENAFINGL